MDRRARFNARKNGDIAPIEARRTLGCWGTASFFFFSAEFAEAILSLSPSTFLRFEVSWISRGENVEGIFEFKFINLLIFTSTRVSTFRIIIIGIDKCIYLNEHVIVWKIEDTIRGYL